MCLNVRGDVTYLNTVHESIARRDVASSPEAIQINIFLGCPPFNGLVHVLVGHKMKLLYVIIEHQYTRQNISSSRKSWTF